MKALLIAEKPSLRRTIEDVYNKHKSEIPYDITFMDQRGHLLTLKMPNELDEDLKEWSWDTLPFHPEDYGGWQYKVIEEKKTGTFLTSEERYRKIREAINSGDYDFVINAGDPDQEGELLIRIVLKSLKCKLPVKRYWSNDTTEGKVLDALKNLRDDDSDPMLVNLLAAAYGRQHSDYRYGMNVSRAATLKLGALVACGRVKTPILAIVCKREYEIKNFVPSTCYGVMAYYSDDFTGQLYEASDSEDASSDEEESSKDEQSKGLVWFDTKEEAEEVMRSLGDSARVTTFESKRVSTFAPKLFKLATLQIAAGKLGFNSAQTLDIIQGLYEKGYLSYPRTDCEYLSSGEDFSAMLNSAASVPILKPFIDSIDKSVIGKVKATKKWVNDKKLAEAGHSALVPTSKTPDFDSLSNAEKGIYALVCRQFVAIFLPPLVQDKTLLITDIDGYAFKSTGKTLVDPGYSKIFSTKFTDAVIPACDEGDFLDVEKVDTISKTTVCPKRFTDADLIATCEAPHKYLDDKRLKALGKRLSIGTPATRASIIKELIDSNHYLQRVKDKKTEHIVPTDVGMQIYDNLKDLDICKVDLTGEWEEMLEQVRQGDMTLDEFENIIRENVESLVENIKSNTDITAISGRRKVIAKCPSCGGDIISGPKGFYCSNYKEKGCKEGSFKKICDTVISDEDFLKMFNGETVTVTLKKGGKSWDQKLMYDREKYKISFVESEKRSYETADSKYSCPACGSPLKETDRKIFCTEEGCEFTFWKETCGKKLTEDQIENFFYNGETGLIKGLKSKKGNKFDANIVLKDDKTGTEFRFPPRK